MRDDIFRVRDSVFDAKRFGGAIRHTHFGYERNMSRAVACELDLLRLDEDRIGSKPLTGLDAAANQLVIADAADIRLQVGDQRGVVPVSALHFEDAKPRFDAYFMGWKW